MHIGSWKGTVGKIKNAGCVSRFLQQIQSRFQIALPLVSVSEADQGFLERKFISINVWGFHTGKCIRRFGGIYAYCRYFIDQKWWILVLLL